MLLGNNQLGMLTALCLWDHPGQRSTWVYVVVQRHTPTAYCSVYLSKAFTKGNGGHPKGCVLDSSVTFRNSASLLFSLSSKNTPFSNSISQLLVLLVIENKFKLFHFTAYNLPKEQHAYYFQ